MADVKAILKAFEASEKANKSKSSEALAEFEARENLSLNDQKAKPTRGDIIGARRGAIDLMRSDRTDVFPELMKTFNEPFDNIKQQQDQSSLKAMAGSMGQKAKLGLQALGTATQRESAVISNPLTELALGERDPKKLIQSIGQGLSGEMLGEPMDVLTALGIGPKKAVGFGLALEAFLPGVKQGTAVIRGIRGRIMDVAEKMGGKAGDSAVRFALSNLQGKKPEVVAFAMEDRFNFFQDRYIKVAKGSKAPLVPHVTAKNTVTNLAKDVETHIYRTANKAHDDIIERISVNPIMIDTTRTARIAQRLDELKANDILTADQKNMVDEAINFVTRKNRENPLGELFSDPLERIPVNVNAKRLLTLQRSMRKEGRAPAIREAVNILGEELESSIPGLERANRQWAAWIDTSDRMERSLGAKIRVGRTNEISSPHNFMNYFDDQSLQTREDIRIINSRLHFLTNKKTANYVLESKRLSAAKEFISSTPSFKALTVGGIATAAATAAVGNSENQAARASILIGGAITSFTLGTPRRSAEITRSLFKTGEFLRGPRAKAIKEFIDRGLISPTLDTAVLHRMTGRRGNKKEE